MRSCFHPFLLAILLVVALLRRRTTVSSEEEEGTPLLLPLSAKQSRAESRVNWRGEQQQLQQEQQQEQQQLQQLQQLQKQQNKLQLKQPTSHSPYSLQPWFLFAPFCSALLILLFLSNQQQQTNKHKERARVGGLVFWQNRLFNFRA